MRSDKQERHERFCQLTEQTITGAIDGGQSIEFEGYKWAVRPLYDWALFLGVKSIDTISDLAKMPPIRKNYTKVDEKKALLLRVGEPGPVTPRMIANIMRAYFFKKTGQYPKPEEFPLLKVLAECWPEGKQVDIFKVVIDDWSTFKVGVSIKIDKMKDNGEKAYHRYHKFPSVSVICRFRDVALELYEMDVQAKMGSG